MDFRTKQEWLRFQVESEGLVSADEEYLEWLEQQDVVTLAEQIERDEYLEER